MGRRSAEITDNDSVTTARRRGRQLGGNLHLLAVDRIRNDGGRAPRRSAILASGAVLSVTRSQASNSSRRRSIASI